MRYFKVAEFDCKHCGANKMEPSFLTLLDDLRHALGFPLTVSSGYRCPVHNAKVSTTGANGPHTTGLAADFALSHERAVLLLEAALAVPEFRGFGVQQKGGGRFVHLDALPRPTRTIWSY